MTLSVGLPSMHREGAEVRAFLPVLVAFLDRAGASEIVLETGYGEDMGVQPGAYLEASPKAKFATHQDALHQDAVLVLRCPREGSLRELGPGTILVSMLHYPTRPGRVALLAELGVRAVSLDGITDDLGKRLVQNMEAVGWNGIRAAFRVLQRTYPRFDDPGRRPLRVTILGSGAVGGHAARAATRYGDHGLRERLASSRVPGVEVVVIDHDLTWNENYMLSRLEQTDLLVDATQRRDASVPVVPNEWVGALPHHSVILDLSVDPYDFSVTPPRVKGIEGIPEGNLDQYVFYPADPAFGALGPRVDTTHRRPVLSCHSWPGLTPRECMEVYGGQVEPVMRVILERPVDEWDVERGTYHERAVARAELSRWRREHSR